jgi:thiol-disulfide isomerase/thioredoxin
MKNIYLWIIIVIIGFILYNNTYQITEKFNENEKVIIKVFNFNTSWCGWSKKLQPEWDKFRQLIIDNNLNHIEVYDIKCDNDSNSQICKEYNVRGYPYIVIEKMTNTNNQSERIIYDQDRTAENLLSYIKQL